MATWKLMGVENERTGEVHNWIARDGTNVGLEEVVDELTAMQQDLADCRKLLLEAVEACDPPDRDGWTEATLDEEWVTAAREAAGGTDD